VSDLFLTLDGDILINGNNDVARVNTSLQNDVQQVYVRLMTEPGDFSAYPNLGVDLSILYGMPQNQQTGQMGKNLILAALNREQTFKGRNIDVSAVPTSPDTIRFDIHVQSGSNQPVTLSIKQNLGA
jgi:hypothetical protein